MAVIYCYLEREIYKLLKFHTNNFFYFEISAPPSFKRNLPKVPYLKDSKPNKLPGVPIRGNMVFDSVAKESILKDLF